MGQIMTDFQIQQFSTAINSYPDELYFPIMRNYLGPIQTPFSKTDLTRRLISFLAKPSVQDHLKDLLDDDDLKILLVLELFGPMDGAALARLFSTSATYPEQVRHLSLLIQRLWVLKTGKTLAPNPLLGPLYSPYLNLSCLFPGSCGKPSDSFTLSREVVKGYLSLAEGKRRAVDDATLKNAFPACPASLRPLFFNRLLSALNASGVFMDGVVDYPMAEKLLSLDRPSLLSYMFSRGSGLDCESYRHLIFLMEQSGSLSQEAFSLLVALLETSENISFPQNLKESLFDWGMLTEKEGILWVTSWDEEGKRGQLVLDSDRSASYSGTTEAEDILWRFATLTKLDVRTVYQITSESFCRGMDSGLGWDEVKNYLSANGAKETLLSELTLCEEQYHEVELFHGIVLKTDERITRLLEAIPQLKQAVLRKLGANVFLMDSFSYPQWSKALKDSLGFLPSLQGESFAAEIAATPKDLDCQSMDIPSPPHWQGQAGKTAVYDPDIKETIAKGALNESVRRGLFARYEDKLIVDKTQIRNVPMEDSQEAGGFDYQGKVSLLRHALSLKNTLINLQVGQDELLVKPQELTKTTDGEMLLKASILPLGESRLIPVGKIFLIRMGYTCLTL